MVRACVYPGCPVKQKRWEKSFHRFPLRDPERTRMWLLALRLDINTPRARVRDLRVCGQHFRDEDYNIRTGALRTTLKSTAVPSPVTHTHTEQDVKMDRAGDLPVDELRRLSPGTDRGDRRYYGYQFPPKLLVTTPQHAKSRIPQRTPSTSGVYKVFPPTRSQPETADYESHLSSCHYRVPAVSSASPEGVSFKPEDDPSAPVEIEIELTSSMTGSQGCGTDPRLCALDEDEYSSLSESSYAILSKEVLLLLMFRCLECSSECRIRGIGKGGSLSLGQECLSCSNYRLWTSRQAEKPKEKVIDAAFITPYEDVFTQTSGNPSCKTDAVQENSDTDIIASVIVKEEWEDCDEEVKEEQESLLIETYDGYASGQDGVVTVKDETDELMPYEDLDFQTGTLLIDETGRVRRAELPRDGDDNEEDLEENSESDEDSSSFDSLEDLKEQSFDLKPFQNTIKPIIWCTVCTEVAKMICTIRRHKKIYVCAECSGDAWEENSTFKNFSVHLSDIRSFHQHAIKEHGAKEIPPKELLIEPGEKLSTCSIGLKNNFQKHHRGDGNALGEEDQSIDDSSGAAKRPGKRARKRCTLHAEDVKKDGESESRSESEASNSDEECTKRGRRKKARRKRRQMTLLHAE
ncbi:zinc finger protein 28 isoform X1 [Clarias magur]|uniref:THAP domain-containing protein 1 n=1 Tax=Clarias magur TaxID=1594786 RepID=A0A8J4XDX4_CLAMG|nr:zinc finger protein 28 isoform X1 [Clarias magur]